jgi:diadenosine tetraphosphate (Ap4A) HIT family hydrolase
MGSMPETPEQLYARVAGDLRMPPVEEWDTFPFDGEMRPRALRPPIDHEVPRHGAGGIDCFACAAPDSRYIWTSGNWRLCTTDKPTGLPVILFLEPRAHYGEPGDLPDDLARELGVMLARVERAVRGIGDVGRVHVCRWGDGSEHLHWWFLARPARLPQLIGSFAAIWDDIIAPLPEDTWRENLAAVVRGLEEPATGPPPQRGRSRSRPSPEPSPPAPHRAARPRRSGTR